MPSMPAAYSFKQGHFLEPAFNGIKELDVGEWLGDVIISAHFHSFAEVAALRFGGQEMNGIPARSSFYVSGAERQPSKLQASSHRK